MKVVIEIAKEDFEACKENKHLFNDNDTLGLSIANGTPLEVVNQKNLTNEELLQTCIKLEVENERLHDAIESIKSISNLF